MNSVGILYPKNTTDVSPFVPPRVAVRPRITAALALLILAFPATGQSLLARTQQSRPRPDFRQLLQKIADLSPDPCGPSHGQESGWDSADTEYRLFRQASEKVTAELNATDENLRLPQDRAEEALKKLEEMSAEVNAMWPEENRFHFQILNIDPALVVKMTLRTDGRFFVFAVPDEDISGKTSRHWQEVGSDDETVEHNPPTFGLELFALKRGPAGNARFLAKLEFAGCAGSIGVVYDAREWHPKGFGELEQVIKQVGSFGLDDKVSGFPRIGNLRTTGPLITLPYCWFSALDTWDNPSLCAVDTYDISADAVRFRSRVYNRPDLLPVAKAIEYAEQRDFRALLGYCASSQIAHRLIRDVPPHIFAEEIRVIPTGKGKQRVELREGTYRFDVEKRAGRWLVVAFSAEN